jgi:hypothetical protein
MTNAMAAFGLAVGGTSLICYALMTRLQNSQRTRRSSGEGSASDGGNYGDGWTLAGWFANDHSMSDSSAIRATSAPAIAAEAEMPVAVTAAAAGAINSAGARKSAAF